MNTTLLGRCRASDSLAPPAGGFPADALVLTRDGELPAGHLTPGDRIITRDAGYATLHRMARARVTRRAVHLRAGSLGHLRPDADLILPAEQYVLIRDWRAQALFGRDRAQVPARALVDGEFITDLGEQTLDICRLYLGGDHVIYAGGLELVSPGIDVSGRVAA
jgi:Hint domain